MLRVLVTGANGFVGRELCQELVSHGFNVRAVVRNLHDISGQDNFLPGADSGKHVIDYVDVGDIGPQTDWLNALQDVDVIVHLAARVHVMQETAVDPLTEFRRVNTEGSVHLARCAVSSGVRRFIYISTIKVNGEMTTNNSFTEPDIPNQQDNYAISKFEAEQTLSKISHETGLEVVIIRPPLVYGEGVKGNFLSLLNLVNKKFPLPLGGISNKRSLIYLKNLVSFIINCIRNKKAVGECFLVSDGEDLSTTDLIYRIARHFDKSIYMFYVPKKLFFVAGKIFGKYEHVHRLLDSLQIDSSKARTLLEWRPPYSVDQGLKNTAIWYRSRIDK